MKPLFFKIMYHNYWIKWLRREMNPPFPNIHDLTGGDTKKK